MTRRLPACWPTKAHRALACGVLLCAWAFDDAAAREHGGGGRAPRQGFAHVAQADARAARQAERAFQRGGQGRGAQRREALPQPAAPVVPMAPAYQPPEPPPQARPGRLTPDERRALRQQINEAGRDVYQPR